jgi:hypothetical protein
LGGTAWKSNPSPQAGPGIFICNGGFYVAKRKSNPNERPGFKFNPGKDYRSERYVMYIMNTETGLLQAGTIEPDLTDGQVIQALEDLIAQLQTPEGFAQLLTAPLPNNPDSSGMESNNKFIQYFVLMNLRLAFERYGPLNAEDTIGILGVIKASVKRWSVGLHRRGYLTYIEGFLGQIGVRVQKLTPAEAEAMGLEVKNSDLEKGD